MSTPLFHVVLHEPEIPNNTGNIGRTCIATGCALSLIRPLGFSTSVKACRRAGLDYWPRLAPREFDSWTACERALAVEAAQPARAWFFTTRAARPVWDASFHRGDLLVFGKETRGLPDDMLAQAPDRLVSLPMLRGERSLNLATAVCAAVYEGLRQLVARGAIVLDADGRLPRISPAETGAGAV
ncbi:MAG: tRNA (cytidine(34)-2'-O)-methyltransferase [Phycisphaerales bacterium]